MVDVHRYHQIAESSHRIMNPLSLDRLMLVGEICQLHEGLGILDLACGKGEMLCQFAERFGTSGVGIDLFPPVVDDARRRASELGVSDRLEFLNGDASAPSGVGDFDVVSCLGASWIGGGLAGTLQIMKDHVEEGGWLLVGEVYWARPPSAELASRYGEQFADLAGTLDVFESVGVDLVEMVLSNLDDWDRYSASQWLNVSDWLLANPDHEEAAEVRAVRDESRRNYLAEERGTLGWGVFLGRAPTVPTGSVRALVR